MSGARKRGFTLVEALVSVVLLAVGIVAAQQAMASISRDEARARQRERLESLAESKMDELLTEASQTPGDQSGDFSDRGQSDVSWTFSVQPSGVENLDAVRLLVEPRQKGGCSEQATLSTLRFTTPTTGATNGTPAAAGGGR